MFYVIFDLEWNNAYNYKTHRGMNEIIEIGAVKLDEKLNIVDTFKQLLKPRISKKLSGRFKELTHISAEEIAENGIDFDDAFADFARWSGRDQSIFMSWSDSDLYVLCDNFKKFKGSYVVDFIGRYVDAQRFCMSFLPQEDCANQISLSHCAEKFDINVQVEGLHRALEDCYLTARCFEKVFDKDILNNYVKECSPDFFERLLFKPYFIKSQKTEAFDLYSLDFLCPQCGEKMQFRKKFDFSNNTFKNFAVCDCCNKKFWVYVRAKQNYDGVSVSKRIVAMNKKRAKRIDNNANAHHNKVKQPKDAY